MTIYLKFYRLLSFFGNTHTVNKICTEKHQDAILINKNCHKTNATVYEKQA